MDENAQTEPGQPTKDLTSRARRIFDRAAPVLRDAHAALERHGFVDDAREHIVERVQDVAQRVERAISNATAVEGTVVEREPAPEDTTTAAAVATQTPAAEAVPAAGSVPPASSPSPRGVPHPRWIAIALITAAAVYGALRFQRRR